MDKIKQATQDCPDGEKTTKGPPKWYPQQRAGAVKVFPKRERRMKAGTICGLMIHMAASGSAALTSTGVGGGWLLDVFSHKRNGRHSRAPNQAAVRDKQDNAHGGLSSAWSPGSAPNLAATVAKPSIPSRSATPSCTSRLATVRSSQGPSPRVQKPRPRLHSTDEDVGGSVTTAGWLPPSCHGHPQAWRGAVGPDNTQRRGLALLSHPL